MNKIMLYLVLICCGIVGALAPTISHAQAEEVTFTWDNPTHFADGRPYDPAIEQAGARIYCNLDAFTFVPETPTTPQTSIIYSRAQYDGTSTSESLFYDSYTCYATVFTFAGWESHLSLGTTFILGTPIPPPPPPPPPEPESLVPMAPTLHNPRD